MNPVGWFEIPVTDMQRAIRFYNALFDWDLQVSKFENGHVEMAWMPWSNNAPGTSGSLIKDQNYTPNPDGVLIYFHCDDVTIQAERVKTLGGTLLQGKTQISPDVGYMALALDSEGNRIAFHSRK